MKPILDPQRDLAGATPETLARALLRPIGPRPNSRTRAGVQAVVRNQFPVKQVATDQPENGVPHLVKRP